jgi:hypothetical protein
MNKLVIKVKGQKQIFEIFDDCIKVELNTAKHNLRYDIPFDDIENEKHIQKSPQNQTLILASISILINVLFTFYFLLKYVDGTQKHFGFIAGLVVLGFVPLLKPIINTTTELHIKASKHLYFIQTNKNKAQIEAFVLSIFENQRKFFRRKFFIIDPILPHDFQSKRYLWLYKNKHINENEYEIIKEELDKQFTFNENKYK